MTEITTAAELDAKSALMTKLCRVLGRDHVDAVHLDLVSALAGDDLWPLMMSFAASRRPDAPARTEPTEEQVRTLRGQLFDAGYREAELLAENKAFVEEIREAKAEAWDEGLSAAYGHVYRQEDADAAGQGVLIPSPANPYRSEADHG